MPVATPTMDRIARRVRVNFATGCVEWQGARSAGYGMMVVGSRSDGSRRHDRVSRIMWRETFGPIPSGMSVLHSCDNPPCVNPMHLFLGTQKDNVMDAIRKGRMKFPKNGRGERSHRCRWTDAQIAEVRERVRSGETQCSVARSMGISQGHVSMVVRRLKRRF